MELTRGREGGATVIRAGGRLTASRVPALRAALLESLAADAHVALVLDRVSQADLTLLQTLCAAQRSAAAAGKTLEIAGIGAAPALRDLVRDSGAARCTGCGVGCAWRAAAAGVREGAGE